MNCRSIFSVGSFGKSSLRKICLPASVQTTNSIQNRLERTDATFGDFFHHLSDAGFWTLVRVYKNGIKFKSVLCLVLKFSVMYTCIRSGPLYLPFFPLFFKSLVGIALLYGYTMNCWYFALYMLFHFNKIREKPSKTCTANVVDIFICISVKWILHWFAFVWQILCFTFRTSDTFWSKDTFNLWFKWQPLIWIFNQCFKLSLCLFTCAYFKNTIYFEDEKQFASVETLNVKLQK